MLKLQLFTCFVLFYHPIVATNEDSNRQKRTPVNLVQLGTNLFDQIYNRARTDGINYLHNAEGRRLESAASTSSSEESIQNRAERSALFSLGLLGGDGPLNILRQRSNLLGSGGGLASGLLNQLTDRLTDGPLGLLRGGGSSVVSSVGSTAGGVASGLINQFTDRLRDGPLGLLRGGSSIVSSEGGSAGGLISQFTDRIRDGPLNLLRGGSSIVSTEGGTSGLISQFTDRVRDGPLSILRGGSNVVRTEGDLGRSFVSQFSDAFRGGPLSVLAGGEEGLQNIARQGVDSIVGQLAGGVGDGPLSFLRRGSDFARNLVGGFQNANPFEQLSALGGASNSIRGLFTRGVNDITDIGRGGANTISDTIRQFVPNLAGTAMSRAYNVEGPEVREIVGQREGSASSNLGGGVVSRVLNVKGNLLKGALSGGGDGGLTGGSPLFRSFASDQLGQGGNVVTNLGDAVTGFLNRG